MSGQSYSLKDLASKVNGDIVGDPNLIIRSIATLQNASSGCISFLSNSKYKKFLSNTSASAVIVNREDAVELKAAGIVVDNPYAAYAIISALFNTHPNPYIGNEINYFVHATSSVDESVIIGPNVYVGPNCKIEKNTIIHANSSLVKSVHIGRNSIIHPSAVLGSDGFGYAPNKNGYTKIEQLGRLIIGSNVEIGAGCTIDRGAIDDTEIHDGVKLDNQVHVAHNVKIGNNCMIAGQVGFAGSSVIGDNVSIGGQAGISGHLNIGNNVKIGGGSGVVKDIADGTVVMGYPALPLKEFLRNLKS